MTLIKFAVSVSPSMSRGKFINVTEIPPRRNDCLSYILFNVDTRTIVFLASTSAALVVNAVIAWLAYRAIANRSATANQRMNQIRKSGVREWIQSLETASTRAAEVSAEVKTEILHFEPTLAAAQDKLARSLARIDHSCDQTCGAVTHAMDRVGKMASKGSWILDRMFSGARAATAFVRSVRAR